MASLAPVVLESTHLSAFIHYILNKHASPSTLVVCSSKETFLKQLQAASAEKAAQQHDDSTDAQSHSIQAREHTWRTPTLRLLASSRTVKLAFCPDVTHLRAYLATFAIRQRPEPNRGTELNLAVDSTRLLAVLNPIQIHRPTSAFSAQGLSRTLSLAVEAAHHTTSRLVLAEFATEAGNLSPEEASLVFDEEPAPVRLASENPWDEEVSILNVTTKSFGAGERGWVGRTVTIRAIAERWCGFEKLATAES